MRKDKYKSNIIKPAPIVRGLIHERESSMMQLGRCSL